MGCCKWKHKINSIVYRNRCLNNTAHRLYCNIEELKCCLCGKSHRDKGRNCRKSTKF